MGMELRTATIQDLELLRAWDSEPHVRAMDPDGDWQWESELRRSPAWREQLMVWVEGRPLGFLQIIDAAQEESHYWGAVDPGLRAIDLWIGDAADLRRGYGTRMMRLALERCFRDPEVVGVLVDPLPSNERACRFYESLGFVFVDERVLGGDEARVYRFDRSSWSGAGGEEAPSHG